jgi:hypothetical protein
MPAVQFEIHTPASGETIHEHIHHALSLNLPEADGEPLKHLTIVASGPSRHLAPLTGDTLAVNGAIGHFLDQGQAPTYWAACDPQELVADFIPDDPPKTTIYLVASKCHPAVFEKLKGRDVRLWHINDYPPPKPLRSVRCASTITLVTQSLMRKAFNYRAFDIYGWDACYEETQSGIIHHAGQPTLTEYPEDTLDLCVGAEQIDGEMSGGRWFRTSRSWAAEAQDAITLLSHADYQVTIHGDGLIKAIRALHHATAE